MVSAVAEAVLAAAVGGRRALAPVQAPRLQQGPQQHRDPGLWVMLSPLLLLQLWAPMVSCTYGSLGELIIFFRLSSHSNTLATNACIKFSLFEMSREVLFVCFLFFPD